MVFKINIIGVLKAQVANLRQQRGIRYTQIGEYTPKLKVIPDNCGVYSIELYFEWKDGTKSIFESYLLQQFYDTAFAGSSLQLVPKE